MFESDNEIQHWTPEHFLWAEVLIDGFRAAVEEKLQVKYPKFIRPRQYCFRDKKAFKWLFSDNRKMGSFLWICSTLQIVHQIEFIRNLYYRAEWSPELMGTRIFKKWHYPDY